MKVFCDTTVLVASAVADHPHHGRAMPAVRRVLDGVDVGCVAAHGLLETYAVLTTLPVAPRIGPEAAEKLVVGNLVGHFEAISLTAREYQQLVGKLPVHGALGGAVYDSLQLACAAKAGADRIYTFNLSDFRRLRPDLTDLMASP